MLEEIAGYVVLAPIVATLVGGLILATWINRRRPAAIRAANRSKHLA